MKKMLAILLLNSGKSQKGLASFINFIPPELLVFPEYPFQWWKIWNFCVIIRMSFLGAGVFLLLAVFFGVGKWALFLMVVCCLIAIVETILFYYFLLDLEKEKKRKNHEQGPAPAPALPITPLLQAVMDGELEKVREVLADNTEQLNTTYAPNGNTPLHVAALNGYVDIVRFLLEQPGLDTTHTNNEGKTALDLAREKGFAEIVQLLESK